MFTQTLSKLFTVARPHPWGGAASLRYTRASGRPHRHSDRSTTVPIPSPRNAARGATPPWNLLGLPLKAAFMSAAVLAGVAPAHGQVFTPLTDSGAHLPLSGPIVSVQPGAIFALTLTVVPHTSFTGLWDASAPPAWQGTFTATGPRPAGQSATGTTLYNFSGLADGVLPTGTYIAFSDLDAGSGGENITLKAFGAGGVPLSLWLDSPAIHGRGTGSGPGGAPGPLDLPSWDWNPATFTYSFDGSTVPGNPTVAFNLLNNTDLLSLQVTRNALNSNFALVAPSPVPEPSEYAAVAGLALAAFGAWRRTRQ